MRFTLLLASSALAASLVLSGCSTSGGSSIPGGTQTAMSHRGNMPEAVGVGAKHDTTCPSTFYECFEVAPATPVTQEWCISDSSPPSCSYLAPGTWTWSSVIYKVKKGKITSKKSKKCKESFSPNPGNPTTLTISCKGKSSKGKIVYVDEMSVSNSVGTTLGPIDIGISVL